MKELFTNRFWGGVKKAFNEALEGPPVKACSPEAAKVEGNDNSGAGTPAKKDHVHVSPQDSEIK